MSSPAQVEGALHPPLLEETIGEALRKAADRWGDREALVSRHQGLRLSWRELDRQASALAAGLLDLGLEPGDRIGIWAPNCAEWLITQLGTARAGLVLVNINPAYRVSELGFALAKVGASALVSAERFKSSDYLAMAENALTMISDPAAVEAPPASPPLLIKTGNSDRKGWLRFDDILRRGARLDGEGRWTPPPGIDPGAPVNIQFTSGTTGLPKGATLSHRSILNNAFFVSEAMGLGEDDRLCVPVPLYHCFGMVMSNLACLVRGAALVYPGAGFDAGEVLAAIEEEKCTAVHGVPTMFIAELEHPNFADHDFRSLRTGIMAGAPCPVAVMRRVIDDMHLRDIGIAYGMTETSPVSFQTAVSDPLAMRVGTVGRVQPHIEAKIIGEDGSTVARGKAGELCVRGYSVMLGYWGEDELTRAAIDEEGWMHSGDLATLDEDGYLRIVGRKKDMIIRGGENIYPREIEEYLHRHPAIAEAQVFGVPDSRFGETVAAWLRLRDGWQCSAEDVDAFCRGQIAHFKIPQHIRFVTDFPVTATGKVQKFAMRDAMLVEDRTQKGFTTRPPSVSTTR